MKLSMLYEEEEDPNLAAGVVKDAAEASQAAKEAGKELPLDEKMALKNAEDADNETKKAAKDILDQEKKDTAAKAAALAKMDE